MKFEHSPCQPHTPSHALDAGSKDGRALVMQLLRAADELKESTSFILAGYKEEIVSEG